MLLTAFVATAGGLKGYHTGVISGAIHSIAADLDLSETEQELVIGSLNVASAFGTSKLKWRQGVLANANYVQARSLVAS